MKIIIDMPEETVNAIKDNVMFGVIPSEILWDVTSAIANGTPLPKVHGDLIDKNELIKMYEKDCGRRIYADNFIFDLENNTTTIIEADKEKEE